MPEALCHCQTFERDTLHRMLHDILQINFNRNSCAFNNIAQTSLTWVYVIGDAESLIGISDS